MVEHKIYFLPLLATFIMMNMANPIAGISTRPAKAYFEDKKKEVKKIKIKNKDNLWIEKS